MTTETKQKPVTGVFMAIVGVDADGVPKTQLVKAPEFEELFRLRLEVAALKDRIGDNAFEDASFEFRRAFRLAAQEARVLALLYTRAPGVVTHRAIFDMLYGHRPDGGPQNPSGVLRVFIHAIKAVIGDDAIEPDHGRGYRLTPAGLAVCDEVKSAAR